MEEDKKSDDSGKDFWKGVLMYLLGGVPFHHLDSFIPPKSDPQAVRQGYFGAWFLVVLFMGAFLACVWLSLKGR